MDQAAISQLSEADLLKAQERTIYDIDHGCWPLHEYMATACRLTLEWTRRQRESDPNNSSWEAWNEREKYAGMVVDMVDDCLKLIETGQSQKAAHTAALAANLFFSYGPATALYDMQEAAKRQRSKGGKGKAGKTKMITKALAEMFSAIPNCKLGDVLEEFEADAVGKECLLTGLREEEKASIRITHVCADRVDYVEIHKDHEKPDSVRCNKIDQKLSALRKQSTV